MTGPRDWDRELAKIDKAIERMPNAPPAPPGGGAPGPAALPPARAGGGAVAAPSRRESVTTWLRVILVLALAAAMPFWPYAKACGPGLWLYVGAAAVVVLAGLWGAVSSWARRRAVAHVLSLLTVLWGLGLVAAEVLPRVGYAAEAARWTCS